MSKLPAGYKIVTNKRGWRFVQLPSGALVPNQGHRPGNKDDTDEQIIEDFQHFLKRNQADGR